MSLPFLEKYVLHYYDVIDSTNLEAKRLIRKGISGHHIVWSISQESGYGKASRVWQSGSGNITFSLIIEHSYSENIICQLLFVIAVGIREVIEKMFNDHNIHPEIKIKWPNDIMVDGRKISGIMIENLKSLEGKSFLVIGVGININYDSIISNLVTNSFKKYNIENIDLKLFIKDIIDSFEKHKDLWSKNGLMPIKKLWMENAYNLGNKVTVTNGESIIIGIFNGIDDHGSINILTESGLTSVVSIGEIIF